MLARLSPSSRLRPRSQYPFDQFVCDVARDDLFLVNTQIRQADTKPMSIILNWMAKVNK